MILKMDALFRDLPQLCQRENLEATGIGKNRPRPLHERMEPAEVPHDLHAGPDEKVIGISENDLRAERGQFVGRNAFHRALRADRHEDRRLDRPVTRDQPAAARFGLGIGVEEGKHGRAS